MSAKQVSPFVPTFAASTDGKKDFEAECSQLFGAVVDVWGVPHSVGQIYGVLFASPEPLCFSDIVMRLKISKGSASQGIHSLLALRAVKMVSSDRMAGLGSTRDYYEPELALRKLVSGVLRERIAPIAAAGADHFLRLQRLAQIEEKENPFLVERVGQIETWRKRFKTVLPVINALLDPKFG